MEKKIQDYLPFYIGQKIMCVKGNSDLEYKGMNRKITPMLLDKYANGKWKLILTPITSMKEKDKRTLVSFNKTKGLPCLYDKGVVEYNLYRMTAQEFKFLLSRGYDLFNLIPARLAIDATSLNKQANKTNHLSNDNTQSNEKNKPR